MPRASIVWPGKSGWLGKYFARRADRAFAEDLRDNLFLLTTEHAAQIIPNADSAYEQERHFDYAVATLATPELHLQFVRVRGEFTVNIAAASGPRKWDSFDSALTWLDIQENTNTQLPEWDYGVDWNTMPWASVDRFLHANWDRLCRTANASSSTAR